MPPPKIKTSAFVANLPLFKELSPAEIGRIVAGTTELHVPRGEILFNKGAPCNGFHLVIYGQVKLSFVTPQGSEKVVEIIGPGMSFGEALMFMERPYIVMAQALADSLLLHVAKQTVFDELERNPGFARKMLAGVSRRLHGIISDLESYSLHSGTQRVIGYLLRQDEGQAGAQPYAVTAADLQGDRRLAPEPHARALLADPARAGRRRPDQRGRPRDRDRGRRAPAQPYSVIRRRVGGAMASVAPGFAGAQHRATRLGHAVACNGRRNRALTQVMAGRAAFPEARASFRRERACRVRNG